MTGTYSGFDADQPTSASGGKPKVARVLKDTKGYKQLVFIGDGVTDAEACPPAVSLTFHISHFFKAENFMHARVIELQALECYRSPIDIGLCNVCTVGKDV